MIELKEGKPQRIILQLTNQGEPYDGQASFRVVYNYKKKDEKVVFDKTSDVVDGKLALDFPSFKDNDYIYLIETEEGHTEPDEFHIFRSLLNKEPKESQLNIELDQEFGLNKDVLGEKAQEFFDKNAGRLKQAEKLLEERKREREDGEKNILKALEETKKEHLSQMGEFHLNIQEQIVNLSDEIEEEELERQKGDDAVTNFVKVEVSSLDSKINGLETAYISADKSLEKRLNVKTDKLSSDITNVSKKLEGKIPTGGILDFTVDDEKVAKNILWSSVKITDVLRGLRTNNQGFHYTTDINDSQSSAETTYSSEYIDANFGGGGASAFTDLTDVPTDYTGDAGKFVKVNGTEDGLEFVTGGGGSVSFGTDNQIPYVNAGGTDFDYSANYTYDGSKLALTGATQAELATLTANITSNTNNRTLKVVTNNNQASGGGTATGGVLVQVVDNGITTGGAAMATLGMQFSVSRSATFDNSGIAGTLRSVQGTVSDAGTYSRASNQTVIQDAYQGTVTLQPVVTGGQQLTHTASGLNINFSGDATVTSGSWVANVYGARFTGGGAVAGTTAYYAFYNSAGGYDTNWTFYNDTANNNFLGYDNSKTYFGTAFDASIYYDGTNLIINPKDVGTGILSVLGGLTTAGAIAGSNLSGTNTGDQTITNSSDATSHTVTLSASGGSVQLIEGSNITLTTGGTGAAGTVTIAATSSGGGMSRTEVTGTSQAGAINTGYIANNAGLVTITLPDTAPVGSILRVVGKGAGGWRIAQNASEQIIRNEGGVDGTDETTIGVTGHIDSTDDYDAVELICITADTTWTVLSSKGIIALT